MVSLNKKDVPYLSKQESMADYYVIGVYGHKNSTFSITVGSSSQPVLDIQPNLPVSSQLNAFSVAYFKYYHVSEKEDIQIALSVTSGAADIYVTTYKPQEGHSMLE